MDYVVLTECIMAVNKKIGQALSVTWKGMLVIFLAIGIIYLVTKLLNKAGKK